jgi:hypothetical protein
LPLNKKTKKNQLMSPNIIAYRKAQSSSNNINENQSTPFRQNNSLGKGKNSQLIAIAKNESSSESITINDNQQKQTNNSFKTFKGANLSVLASPTSSSSSSSENGSLPQQQQQQQQHITSPKLRFINNNDQRQPPITPQHHLNQRPLNIPINDLFKRYELTSLAKETTANTNSSQSNSSLSMNSLTNEQKLKKLDDDNGGESQTNPNSISTPTKSDYQYLSDIHYTTNCRTDSIQKFKRSISVISAKNINNNNKELKSFKK